MLRDPDVGYVEEQLAEMKDTVFTDGPDTRLDEQASGMSEILEDPNSKKALFIGVGLMFVQQLSGINAIMFYAGEIFNSVPGTTQATANDYSTGMQGMQVAITLSSAFFMDKAGRVPILLFAGVGQFFMCMFLAYYYLFASCTRDAEGVVTEASMGNFPVVSLYLYVFFFSCGMGAIPWFIMGEIFKPSVKGLASSIATATNWLLSFVITFTVASLTSAFESLLGDALPHAIDAGMGGLFAAYGTVCFLGVFFVFFVIPETKGLTAREVQHKLSGKKGPLLRGSFASSFASSLDDFETHEATKAQNPLDEHESILNPM